MAIVTLTGGNATTEVFISPIEGKRLSIDSSIQIRACVDSEMYRSIALDSKIYLQ